LTHPHREEEVDEAAMAVVAERINGFSASDDAELVKTW
jgi:hypothetical protein